MADAEGLEHAPQTVIEMVAKHDHRDDVEERNRPHLEAGDDIVIDVVFVEVAARMNGPERKVEKMKNDEGEKDRATPHHGARGVSRVLVDFSYVPDGTCNRLQTRHLNGLQDVENHGDQKNNARAPKERGQGF